MNVPNPAVAEDQQPEPTARDGRAGQACRDGRARAQVLREQYEELLSRKKGQFAGKIWRQICELELQAMELEEKTWDTWLRS